MYKLRAKSYSNDTDYIVCGNDMLPTTGVIITERAKLLGVGVEIVSVDDFSF